MTHPMQELYVDGDNVVRFRENKIVRRLLDEGGLDLNWIAEQNFSQDDRQQFAQLIGYSVRGYHELFYVSDDSALAASQMALDEFGMENIGCRTTGCPIHGFVETEESDWRN